MVTDKQPGPRPSSQRPPQPTSQHQQNPDAPKAATPPPPDPNERRRQQTEQAQREARCAGEMLIPAALNEIIGQPDLFGPLGIQEYTKRFVEEAGSPTDPVERVLVQQLLLAHHRAAQLQGRAEKAKHVEEVKVLNTAAVRLISEIRRMALAIRQYRAPIGSKNFTVVHQQNLATGADQRVTYVDQSTKGQENVSFSARTELNVKPTEDNHNGHQSDRTSEEPESRSRWSDQRLQAAAVDG